MTDHLPECCIGEAVYAPPSSSHSGVPVDRGCICDRLRQAEQRGYENGCIHAAAKYPDIYRDGVTAARDAVLGTSPKFWPYDSDNDAYHECITVDDALDAIDALRGESDG